MEGVFSKDQVFVLVLLMGIVIVYGQAFGFRFLIWDDSAYVLRPPVSLGITIAGMKSAFTSQVMTHWHPLTVLSHMLDVEIFGLNPGAHHGVSMFLHMLNSLLLFALLKTTTRKYWPSVFVTALWALHPLHVENVAWVSDRKDLLCALFGLLALHAYVRFTWCRRLHWYGVLLLCYILGLLSKSMIVTLPVMCLLLDVWPLQRMDAGSKEQHLSSNPKRARHWTLKLQSKPFIEKAPLFVIALCFAVLTYATTQRGGMLEYYGRVGFWDRLTNSVCSHAWYIVKTVWPSRLAGLFVHPNLPGGTPWQMWQIIGSICLLGGISYLVWRSKRSYLAMGWLWFLLTLAPVNGIVQYGNLSRAGRCMYLPMIGLLIMLVWGVRELFQVYRSLNRNAVQHFGTMASIAMVLVLAGACWVETGYWKDDVAFNERQMELVPNNPYHNNNMALTYLRLGKYEKAQHHASKAITVWPKLWQSHDLLARIYVRQGDTEAANYHSDIASSLKADLASEHRQWLSRNVFAATIDDILKEQ
jgi:hypothetical protein